MSGSHRNSLRLEQRRGFTLLEVMIAMGILAMALVAIGMTTSSSIIGSAKVYRMTTASLVMRGIVLDIEEEYKTDPLGFPENDLEGKDCDVPKPFDDDFDCEYDLEGMKFEEGQLETIASSALAQLTGGQDPMAMIAGARGGKGGQPGAGPPGAEAIQGMLDPAMVPALAMLLSPGGEELAAMCNINLAGILMSVVGITQFFPQIVQKASEQTRKLTVRLTWHEGRGSERELMVETFIVAIPEEQEELMKAMGKADEQGLLPGGDAAVPQGGGGIGNRGGVGLPAGGGIGNRGGGGR